MSTLFVDQFGAVGDGVTDDAEAFKAIGVLVRSNPTAFTKIVCGANKIYAFSHQEFLSGCLNVEIEGNGSVWTVPDGVRKSIDQAQGQNNPFRGWDLSDPDQMRWTEDSFTGCRFHTAPPGTSALYLTAQGLADAQNSLLRLGICLIHSGTKQGAGWPPNPAFWEWGEIIDIDGGMVSLRRPTTYEHREDHIPCSQVAGVDRRGWGPSRIASLEGAFDGTTGPATIYYGRRIIYRDLIFRPKGAYTVGSPASLYVRYQNCTFDFDQSTWQPSGTSINLTQRVDYVGCVWTENAEGVGKSLEIDKMMGSALLSGCRLARVTQATGIERLTMTDCDFEEGTPQSAANYTVMDGCRVTTSSGLMISHTPKFAGGGGVVRGCTVTAIGDIWRLTPALPSLDTKNNQFEVEQIGPNGELIWNYAGQQGLAPAALLTTAGQTLIKPDGSNAGTVTRVAVWNEELKLGAVYAKMQNPACIRDVFHFHPAWAPFEDYGGNVVRAEQSWLSNRISGTQYWAKPNETTKYQFGMDGVKRYGGKQGGGRAYESSLMGWIKRVEVNVIKGYSGVVSDHTNRLELRGFVENDVGATLGKIDLTTLGRRYFDVANPASNILLGSDEVSQVDMERFYQGFHIIAMSTNSWPDESDAVLPIVAISICVNGLSL